MNNSDILISVGTNLTEDEVNSIKSVLTSMNIAYSVNGHGAASRYRSYYYEIKVRKDDFAKAKTVVEKRQQKTFAESQQCPKCRYTEYEKLPKNGIWEKVYYYGTTLVRCKKCKTKYSV